MFLVIPMPMLVPKRMPMPIPMPMPLPIIVEAPGLLSYLWYTYVDPRPQLNSGSKTNTVANANAKPIHMLAPMVPTVPLSMAMPLPMPLNKCGAYGADVCCDPHA